MSSRPMSRKKATAARATFTMLRRYWLTAEFLTSCAVTVSRCSASSWRRTSASAPSLGSRDGLELLVAGVRLEEAREPVGRGLQVDGVDTLDANRHDHCPDVLRDDLQIEEVVDDVGVGISLQELRASQGTVLGVAGGSVKSTAILGALSGGFLDVLVTDTAAASTILAEMQGD